MNSKTICFETSGMKEIVKDEMLVGLVSFVSPTMLFISFDVCGLSCVSNVEGDKVVVTPRA